MTGPTADAGMALYSRSIVLWFCGFSGAGKSAVAEATAARFETAGARVALIDGDAVRDRRHLSLGFSVPDILENNRRIAQLCAARRAEFDVVLVPVISPLEAGRRTAREIIGPGFYLVYCEADVQTVRGRDVKGLYARADRGEITDMIGYSAGAAPFEPPTDVDIVLKTGTENLSACCGTLYEFASRLTGDDDLPSVGPHPR